jgi:hypothetical protein
MLVVPLIIRNRVSGAREIVLALGIDFRTVAPTAVLPRNEGLIIGYRAQVADTTSDHGVDKSEEQEEE